MDEIITPPPDENEPYSDLMPPPPEKKGCLPKTIAILVVLGIGLGLVVFFAINFVKGRMSKSETSSNEMASRAEAPPPVPVQTATPVPEEPSLTLAKQLVTADATTRKEIAAQLAASEGSLSPAIDYLTSALPTAMGDVRPDIIVALGMLAKKDPLALPPLLNALDDKSLRREAIPALGALGPEAKAAIPKLKKIAANKKERKAIRLAARKALAQIQGKKTAAKKSARGKKRTVKR